MPMVQSGSTGHPRPHGLATCRTTKAHMRSPLSYNSCQLAQSFFHRPWSWSTLWTRCVMKESTGRDVSLMPVRLLSCTGLKAPCTDYAPSQEPTPGNHWCSSSQGLLRFQALNNSHGINRDSRYLANQISNVARVSYFIRPVIWVINDARCLVRLHLVPINNPRQR